MWEGRVILETERLVLRTFREDDVPLIRSLNASPVVMQYLGGVMSAESSNKLAEDIERGFATHGIGKIAVERRSDRTFLGLCGLSRESWYPDDLEVGWRLLPEHWGKGYATESAAAWIDHAFGEHRADRVISISDVPNARSIAVMKRLGFRFDHEATLSDDHETFLAGIYVLAPDDWRRNRPQTGLAGSP
jgi:RimJ/RimL family protein N-acetyltransferase